MWYSVSAYLSGLTRSSKLWWNSGTLITHQNHSSSNDSHYEIRNDEIRYEIEVWFWFLRVENYGDQRDQI